MGAVDSGVWRAGGPPWRTQRPTRVESHNLSERPNRQPTHSTLVHLDTRVCSYCTSVRLHPGSTRIPVTLDRHVDRIMDRMPRTGPRWLTLSARVHLHPTPLYFTSWPVESVKLFILVFQGSSGAVLSIYVHSDHASRRRRGAARGRATTRARELNDSWPLCAACNAYRPAMTVVTAGRGC